MVIKRDAKYQVEFIQRFFIKPISGLLSINKVKRDNDKIV